MSALDWIIPTARRIEADELTIGAGAFDVWSVLRGDDDGCSPFLRSLFALRPRPATDTHDAIVLDAPSDPQVLATQAPGELVVGALYALGSRQLTPVAVRDAYAFLRFAQPGHVKVAWAMRLVVASEAITRVVLELRVDATDPASWERFRREVCLLGPGSHRVREALLVALPHGSDAPAPPPVREPTIHPVLEGLEGAAIITAALLTPFLRTRRERWGVPEADLARRYPGDELVETPRWSWTHAIEIEAPMARVWPWVAQLGADRGGFYSYEWLENLAGCALHNAERVHPEWEARVGGMLRLHPKVPALRVVAVERGRHLVAHAPADERARAEGRPWASASWAFVLEPCGSERCRLVSRYRAACSDDLVTRLGYGELLAEPIGFAMDRRMLRGIKERAERTRPHPPVGDAGLDIPAR